MELVRAGFQRECHHPTVCDAALCAEPAGLSLHFFYRLHAGPGFHGIPLNLRRGGRAINRIVFCESLRAIDDSAIAKFSTNRPPSYILSGRSVTTSPFMFVPKVAVSLSSSGLSVLTVTT